MNTTGQRARSAIRLGIAIRPFNVSDIFQARVRSIVAPIIITGRNSTLYTIAALLPRRYSQHLDPYRFHEIIVVRANSARAIAIIKLEKPCGKTVE